MNTNQPTTDLDGDQLTRTRPCRISWCDTCQWETDPTGSEINRTHIRHVDGFTLFWHEAGPGAEPSSDTPEIRLATVDSVTLDEARAMTSTLLYLTGLVERDTRTGR